MKTLMALGCGVLVVSSTTSALATSGVARVNSAGDLDVTFSGDGKFSDAAAHNNHTAARVQPFTGGKTIIAGTFAPSSGTVQGILGRYNVGGEADSTFGFFGVTAVDFSSTTNEFIWAVDVQSSLKIVVAGVAVEAADPRRCHIVVWRFSPNGIPDSTFGDGGKKWITVPNADVYDMAIMNDKVVVVGHVDGQWAVLRLKADGSLDTTFNKDGFTRFPFVGALANEVAHSVSVDGGNALVVVGNVTGNPLTQMGAVRIRDDGELDPGFGTGGKLLLDFPDTTREVPFGVECFAGNQGCVIVGTDNAGSPSERFAFTRINGSTGGNWPGWRAKTIPFTGSTSSRAINVAFTNETIPKVVISGTAVVNGVEQLAVARLLSDQGGALDSTFTRSRSGRLLIPFNPLSISNFSLAINPQNNSIFLGGS